MALDANDFRGIYGALESVKPERIQIMEVYPNVSSIPAEIPRGRLRRRSDLDEER